MSRVEARFLAVWFACVGADWLQGPYLYALYADRHLSRKIIARLFATGFVASGFLGSFVGGLCDRIGRRRGCQLYCYLMCLSCLLTHSTTVCPLVLGRLLGGVADSLLYSAFEAWAIEEYTRDVSSSEGAPLSRLLGRMWLGSWLVAIVAGFSAIITVRLVSPWTWCGSGVFGIARIAFGGPTAVFDLAALCCVVGAVLISVLWRKDQTPGRARKCAPIQVKQDKALLEGCRCRPGSWRASAIFDMKILRKHSVLRSAVANPRITLCGATIAIFEGSMFVFVFSWSPVLVAGCPEMALNLGLAFSSFMACCACGSFAFEALLSRWSASQLISPILGLAGLSLLGAAFAARAGASDALLAFAAFLVFELCVGLYFPCIGALKSETVPDSIRTLVYSLYRVPLNALALVVLLGVPSPSMAFAVCAVALLSVAVLAVRFREPQASRRAVS